MKRTLGSLAAAMVAAGAMAQTSPFTIVRPYDGAHVREKVHILFPKGSIPSGGYVGIFLKGQLIDAVVPPTNGKFAEYVLDTKGRGIPDTEPGKPDRLEAKLFVDYNDQPRITKTSSIDLYIGNNSNIKVPAEGILLRYKFKPGTEMVYDMQQRVAMDTISESENEKGGKAAELPLDSEKIRLLYAIDGSYPDGDGLLRMQALPEKGKHYAVLTAIEATTLAPETRPFYDQEMASVYMKLNSTGHEVFGSVPAYFTMEGAAGTANASDLWAVYPLPTLPVKAVSPGDVWQSRILEGNVEPNNLLNQNSLVKTFPAAGKFEGVEWERDHPCAKITNTISESEMSNEDKKMLQKGAEFAGEKIKLEETIWFALDTHKILKIVRDETIETKTQGAAAPGGPGGMPGYPGGMPGGRGYPGGPGGRGGYPGGGQTFPPGSNEPPGGGKGEGDWILPGNQVIPLNQMGPPRMRNMGSGGGGAQNPMMPGAMGPGMGPGMGTGAPAQNEFLRLRIEQVFTLEE